jgi:hypothetical protein
MTIGLIEYFKLNWLKERTLLLWRWTRCFGREVQDCSGVGAGIERVDCAGVCRCNEGCVD